MDINTQKATIDNMDIQFTERTVDKSRTYKLKATVIQISKKVLINKNTPIDIIEKLIQFFISKVVQSNNLKDNDKIGFSLVSDDDTKFYRFSKYNTTNIFIPSYYL